MKAQRFIATKIVSRRREQFVLCCLAFIWVVVCLFPIWDLFSVAFTTEDINPMRVLAPNSWSAGIHNLKESFQYANVIQSTIDTFLYTLLAIAGMLLICTLASYEFSFYQFPLKKPLFSILMMSMMLPMILYVIPLYRMVFHIGLSDTYLGIALPLMISPLSVFIMNQFCENIPISLIESARIDGAGHFRIYGSIVLPLMRNGLITASVLLFLRAWGSYLWPSLVAASNIKPMSVSITNMLHPNFYVPTRVKIAAMLMAMVPPLVFYVVFQKYVIQGIAMSGLKG